jgi:hypothetical protein
MRIRAGAGVLAVIALVAAGCSSERDAPNAPLAFCRPASNYDYALSTKGRDLPIARQIRYLEAMVAAAPKAIEADARVYLDALERVREDPTSVVDNPKVKEAVENVNRYAAQGCEFYARRSGGI